MTRLALLLLVLVAGCGYPESQFKADYATEWCKLLSDCQVLQSGYGYSSESDCEAQVSPGADTAGEVACSAYDPKSAKDCITAIQLLSCHDLYSSEPLPASCSDACGG